MLTFMLGSRCRHQFCWVCSVDYNLIFREGNHRHEKSCTHYRTLSTDEVEEDAGLTIAPVSPPLAAAFTRDDIEFHEYLFDVR
jgi:hypothetical protein